MTDLEKLRAAYDAATDAYAAARDAAYDAYAAASDAARDRYYAALDAIDATSAVALAAQKKEQNNAG
jgi:hypothetical protein